MSKKPFELNKKYNYNDYSDYRWDSKQNSNTAQTSYQNYYLSGNDVTIGIVPFYHKNKIIPIPVTDMAFGISQEKVPIYSAFSYTWDAVAKGTRIIRGEFSIVFTKPNHIGRLLGDTRTPDNPDILDSSSSPVVQVGSENLIDEKTNLKEQFWGDDTSRMGDRDASEVMVDPNLAFDFFGDRQRPAFPFGRPVPEGRFEADFAGHQPFDMIIMFGSSVATHKATNDKFDGFSSWGEGIIEENKYYSSFNDDSNPVSEKIILKNIELMSCGIGLDPSGQPLRESYSFIARDALIGV